MSETPGKPECSRKPYEPPLLTRVSLRPEEAVLGNCKFMGMAGPASSSCSSLLCKSLGS